MGRGNFPICQVYFSFVKTQGEYGAKIFYFFLPGGGEIYTISGVGERAAGGGATPGRIYSM